jgi:hypothetical protein
MLIKRLGRCVTWGIKWAVTFIIFYQIVFALSFRFTPGDPQHFYVPSGSYYSYIGERIYRVLNDYPLGLGEIGLEMNIDDQYLALLVYVPYFASIQYFVFGGVFGWWLSSYERKRMTPAS